MHRSKSASRPGKLWPPGVKNQSRRWRFHRNLWFSGKVCSVDSAAITAALTQLERWMAQTSKNHKVSGADSVFPGSSSPLFSYLLAVWCFCWALMDATACAQITCLQEGDDRNRKLCLNVLSVSICTRVNFKSSVIDISMFVPKLFIFFFSSEKWHLPTTCKTCLYVIFGSRIHAYSLPSVYHPTPCDLCSAAVWMRSASCHLLMQPRWLSKRECGARQEAAILVAGTITYSATSKHHPALHHHRAGTWRAWT